MKLLIRIIIHIIIFIIITCFYLIVPICCYFTVFHNNWNNENGIAWYGYIFGFLCFCPHLIVIFGVSYFQKCIKIYKFLYYDIITNKDKECKVCKNNKILKICNYNKIYEHDNFYNLCKDDMILEFINKSWYHHFKIKNIY